MTPPKEDHGPLPTLLGLLTLLTGFVDAVTYLKYGHVFVANMTGNVVLLGFGVAGSRDISITGSILALLGFLGGALAGGVLNERLAVHRGNLLVKSTFVKFALLLSATLCAIFGVSPFVIIPILGLSMGMQNAVARKLAIADITTTVLTMTLTGIMADSALAGGKNPRLMRRLSAVATMFVGGLAGAGTVLYLGIPYALAAAATIVFIVGVAAFVLGRNNPTWVRGA
ncbi:MAG: YoaK family protein [Vulcanimicrobiaceae bacterium]